MKVILVTGTPGTGKTHLSKQIADRFSFRHIDLTSFVGKMGLSEGYDEKRQCDIVDPGRVSRELKRHLQGLEREKVHGVVVDSHFSHLLKLEKVDLVVILRCELSTLKGRLEKRGYTESKVRENLDSEIFEICRLEAQEQGFRTMVVDSPPSKQNLSQIASILGI